MGVGRYAEAVSPPESGGISLQEGSVRHIGVDLHKLAFTACFLDEDDSQQLATFPLTAEGLAAFRTQLLATDQLALEVGQNAYFFHDQVRDAVAEIQLVSPYQFAVIAKSKKKTDRQDAKALARFLKLGCLPTVVMPDDRIRELRQLFTAREAFVKVSRQLKNMGHAALVRNGIASRKADFASGVGRRRLGVRQGLRPSDRRILDAVLRQLEGVEAELIELERAIIRAGKNLPGLKRLLQVRGLGLVAAIGVLSEIGDIGRFASAKQLVSYSGLATAVHQSGGTERYGHITKQGRKRLRGFMVEAVLSLVRNPGPSPLVDFYQRKKKEKGTGKAICAAARKLLATIYVLLTKGLDYWFLEERLYQGKLRALAAA
jgi:transposase